MFDFREAQQKIADDMSYKLVGDYAALRLYLTEHQGNLTNSSVNCHFDTLTTDISKEIYLVDNVAYVGGNAKQKRSRLTAHSYDFAEYVARIEISDLTTHPHQYMFMRDRSSSADKLTTHPSNKIKIARSIKHMNEMMVFEQQRLSSKHRM